MSAPLEIKGFAWLNLLTLVKERHPADVATRLQAAFPQYAQWFDTQKVLPIGWVPGALHLGAVKWLVEQRYGGTMEGARTLGTELATRNVSSAFKSFNRLEDLKIALTSTERAFGQFYSQGTMKFTLTGDELEANLTDFPLATELFGNVLGAGLVAFLRAGNVEASLTSVKVGQASITYHVKLVLPSTSRLSPLPR
ncbi:MAG: hypothetical protein ACOZQL_22505 [Myxococcota bacterium]